MRLLKFGLMVGVLSFCAGGIAFAQHTDESFTTTSQDCAGIKWSERVLQQYPNVVPACQSVEIHNGISYVKFSGTVVRSREQGRQLTLKLKGGKEVTVAMPQETTLSVDGKKTPLAQLQRGQELNFYIPQNRVVAEFYAAEQPTTEAPAVLAPIEVPPEPERVASLPATASDTPVLLVSGLLMVLLAGGLAITRIRRS